MNKILPLRCLTAASSATLAFIGLLSLTACGEHSTAVNAPAPAPIVQGNQLRFADKHPQLALLGLSTARESKSTAIELPAKLVWNEDHTQRIYASFAGRVNSIHADVGQAVHAGKSLATLASPEFGAAQADAAKAMADVRLSEKNLQRQRELFDAGIVARKEFDAAQSDAERARAESQRAESRIRLYGGAGATGADLVNQQLSLVSNIAGLVVERNINPGQELRPDQSGVGVPPLFVVSDPSSLWVQIDAREAEIGAFKPGASFDLVVPSLGNQVFKGHVSVAADMIDPSSRTIKVRGLVANAKRLLKAEMLATARIERTMGAGVIVPASAVLLYGAKHQVFVQSSPGVFEPREVSLSFEGAREVVVSDGLRTGEQVVSDNVLLLGRLWRLSRDNAPSASAAALAKTSSPLTNAAKPSANPVVATPTKTQP
jgi:membrane fusion protein, heavy metal efflux system